MRIDVSLLRVLEGLSEYDILKVMAGLYIQNEYDVDFEDDDDLDIIEEYVETDNDLLINIQNTFANIDRDYSDEDNDEDDYNEESNDDCDDYENDDYDEEDNYDDYWNSYNEDEVDDDTQRLIEENRKKNEIALGL